jgi:hypothetical protein
MNDIRQQIISQAASYLAKQKNDLIKEALDNLLGEWNYKSLLGKCMTYHYRGDPNEYFYYEGKLIAVFGPWEFEEDKITFKYWRYS